MNIYEMIREAGADEELCLFTVLDGKHAGEKALIRNNSVLWTDGEQSFFESCAGQSCAFAHQGIVTYENNCLFCEMIGTEKTIVLCGGGHVALQTMKLARMIGMRTVVIEDREDFAEKAALCGADQTICAPFVTTLKNYKSTQDTYFVIVTRGHRYDLECLETVLEKPNAYIGMIGSRRKVKMVMDTLRSRGCPEDILSKVNSPIGLAIGAETPEEIAVSIIAQIIEVKNKAKKNQGIPANILREIVSEEREDEVLATIIRKTGSVPRSTGSRMLVAGDGSIVGTIGGGSGEYAVIKESTRYLTSGKKEPQIVHIDLNTQDAEKEGMVCGGSMDVLLERV